MEAFSTPPHEAIRDERLVGMQLGEIRIQKGIELSDVVNETKIRSCHLIALEQGRYEAIPGGEPYVRGFLRCYARALNVGEEMILRRYYELRQDRLAREAAIAASKRPKPSWGRSVARSVAGGFNFTVQWLLGE